MIWFTLLIFRLSFGSMDLVIMTESLPEAEKRNGRKGETRREKGKREGTGIQREAGTGTEIGGEAKTGRGSEIGMVRRKGTVTGTTIIEIVTGIGIVAREGKGEGIEMTMIITKAVTMTGESLFWILMPSITVGA